MPAHAQRVLSGHMHTRRIEAHTRSPDCPRSRSSGSKRQRWPQHKSTVQHAHCTVLEGMVSTRSRPDMPCCHHEQQARATAATWHNTAELTASENGEAANTGCGHVHPTCWKHAGGSKHSCCHVGDGCHAAPSSIDIMRHVQQSFCTDWLVDRSRGSVASCCYSLSRAMPVLSVSS